MFKIPMPDEYTLPSVLINSKVAEVLASSGLLPSILSVPPTLYKRMCVLEAVPTIRFSGNVRVYYDEYGQEHVTSMSGTATILPSMQCYDPEGGPTSVIFLYASDLTAEEPSKDDVD